MVKNTRRVQRGETSLSRERIIEAAIALLDSSGTAGLTFRALAQQLATGAGAIYYHVDNKTDLLNAACDMIVTQTMAAVEAGATPQDAIRAIALGLFDAIDGHPWMGSALMLAPTQMPMVRILESLGRQVRALGVPQPALWSATSALLHYIFGVAGQNAGNAQIAVEQQLERPAFLGAVAAAWSQLDADQYPFTRSVAAQMREHDDRADFLAGIDLILAGIQATIPPAI